VHGREIRDTPNSMGLMLSFSMLTLPVGAIGDSRQDSGERDECPL
jgi:hypothetical protein